jgi:hypothetical protein
MSFEPNEKVLFLDSLVNETLILIHYPLGWELSSYEKDSLFSLSGPIGHVQVKGFTGCINRAMRLVKERIANV